MKQILQSFKSGKTALEAVPAPQVSRECVLVQTTHTLVSLGTERMLVEFGKAGWVNKARQQPDKVKQVFDKIKTDGLLPTIENVMKRLEEPLPLGYCNVGKVIAVGEGVSGISVGDRVASNGKHAEYVNVPKNLVVKIPDNVSDEEGTFTVIGSIGLQGIRLCDPTFGESIVVYGMGLIGLLTAKMLLANGCNVIGIDVDEDKCEMAKEWGLLTINPAKGEDAVKSVYEYTENIGADGVIITASANNNDIISQSAQMSRKRGRIILVGVVGLNLSRAEFYDKELTFQVSCSYGPGRYDEKYEQQGIDYPLPFVRWTENRNMQAFLQALSKGHIHVKELISEVVDLDQYLEIYGDIGKSKSIASILKYPVSENGEADLQHTIRLQERSFTGSKGVLGIIGAGNFTKMTLLPALNQTNANFKYIASKTGVNGTILAKKYGFSHSTTDYHEMLNDPEVDTVMITTQHNTHAKFVLDAMDADKNVFVEKPLAINSQQLDAIIEKYQNSNFRKTITVGFNRRFSPHIQAIKNSLGDNPGAINLIATMNAGYIPENSWIHDMEIGGGRVVGEACHHIDLCVYLTGSEIESVCMNAMGENPSENTDNASILLKFKNGSNAVINYFANGSKAYSKERLEAYSRERTYVMDNFRVTNGYGVQNFKKVKTKINKGHKAQFNDYINRIQLGGDPLIPFNEIINVTKASFAAIQSLKEKRWVEIN
jgi:predicted dehydrogenase/threonine dehydrogenase-like Zn-dependent dehydrogenase